MVVWPEPQGSGGLEEKDAGRSKSNLEEKSSGDGDGATATTVAIVGHGLVTQSLIGRLLVVWFGDGHPAVINLSVVHVKLQQVCLRLSCAWMAC